MDGSTHHNQNMFPNQPNRDSWGSVAGYYGNYGMSGAGSWYNWAGQPAGRQANCWGYQSTSSPPPDGGGGGGGTNESGSNGTPYEARDREAGSFGNSGRGDREAANFANGGTGRGGSSERESAKMPKLGINSNIYSLYQNRHHHQSVVSLTPDVTISSMTSIARRDLELEAGGFSGGRRGAESAESPSAESLYTACMQQQQQQEEEEAAALHHQAAAAAAAVAARSNQEQLAGGECGSLLAQQQQQLVDQHRELGRRLVIDEGPSMEPDSSTDLSLASHHQHQLPINEAAAPKALLANHSTAAAAPANERPADREMEDDDDLELEQEKMFQNSKHFAQYFKLKAEPLSSEPEANTKRPPKFFKSPRREFSELVKEANEKMASKLYHGAAAANNNNNNNGGLPLSVEIEELDSSSDSASPPRNLSMSYFPNSLAGNSLSPRKRGRKPKHYSEILYELGQRGISITKTHKMAAAAAASSQQQLHHQQQQQQLHHNSFHHHHHQQQQQYRRDFVLGPPSSSPSPLPNHIPPSPALEGGAAAAVASHSKPGSQQQLKCPHCNKILTTSVGLMYHIRLHTGEKPYSCDLCGKSFATSSHYHYHIRTHSGEKPYRRVPFRCDFCGKMYTASGSLRLHLKSHLSRLAANAFNLNSLGMNGLGGGEGGGGGGMSSMFRGLEAMFAGGEKGAEAASSSLPHHQPDLAAKFAQIKQEILEAEPDLGGLLTARGRGSSSGGHGQDQQQEEEGGEQQQQHQQRPGLS